MDFLADKRYYSILIGQSAIYLNTVNATELRYFGTDGIRGHVGDVCVNPEFILKLGWAFGKVLTADGQKAHVLIGKDTRISGYMLESALEAGFSAAGVDIHLLGPMPTPAVAYLTRTLRAKAGIVISASHNPYNDNGIKFFSAEGCKLSNDVELAIERMLDEPLVTVDSNHLGKAIRIIDAPGRYIEFCKHAISTQISLAGLKIVVDCANGATYHIAPNVYRELGAEVIELAVKPNGFNINADCGSTQPAALQSAVLDVGADVGIALDGDGDRIIMIDANGEIVDGDELLFIIAKHLHRAGTLRGGVVGTVMSNVGMERAFQDLEIPFIRTDVGDRHIARQLHQLQWQLGGESSGHIIHLGFNQTGDGIVAGLLVLAAMGMARQPLAKLKQGMCKFPQVTCNLQTYHAQTVLKSARLQKDIQAIISSFDQNTRALIRSSGTEPVIRVMVESSEPQLLHAAMDRLTDVIRESIKQSEPAVANSD